MSSITRTRWGWVCNKCNRLIAYWMSEDSCCVQALKEASNEAE